MTQLYKPQQSKGDSLCTKLLIPYKSMHPITSLDVFVIFNLHISRRHKQPNHILSST